MTQSAGIAFRGGTILDGTGAEPRGGQVVVIEGERIARVVPESTWSRPRDCTVIDAEGCTILPGLIDAHVHFFGSRSPDPMMWAIEPPFLNCARAVSDAWKMLDSGFTTVRDVGSRNGVAIKRAVDEGAILGPRVVPAHMGLSMTCGHGDVHNLPSTWLCNCSMMAFIADGVDNVRQAVRQTVRDGADVIKVWVSGGTMSERDSLEDQHYSDEELQTLVGEAHRLRRKVAAHAEGILGARAAVRAGADSIEHGFVLDEELCDEMRRKGVFLVATLALLDGVINTPGTPDYAKVKALPMYERHRASFRLAVEMGVKIGSGSDAFSDPVTPYGSYNIQELKLMVDNGLTPVQAVKAATSANAELLGLDKIGVLAQGMRADLLVVKGQVGEDIEVLLEKDNILTIVKDGRRMPRLRDCQPV